MQSVNAQLDPAAGGKASPAVTVSEERELLLDLALVLLLLHDLPVQLLTLLAEVLDALDLARGARGARCTDPPRACGATRFSTKRLPTSETQPREPVQVMEELKAGSTSALRSHRVGSTQDSPAP